MINLSGKSYDTIDDDAFGGRVLVGTVQLQPDEGELVGKYAVIIS